MKHLFCPPGYNHPQHTFSTKVIYKFCPLRLVQIADVATKIAAFEVDQKLSLLKNDIFEHCKASKLPIQASTSIKPISYEILEDQAKTRYQLPNIIFISRHTYIHPSFISIHPPSIHPSTQASIQADTAPSTFLHISSQREESCNLKQPTVKSSLLPSWTLLSNIHSIPMSSISTGYLDR